MIFHVTPDGKKHSDSSIRIETGGALKISYHGNIFVIGRSSDYNEKYYYDYSDKITRYTTDDGKVLIECSYMDDKLCQLTYQYGSLEKEVYYFDYSGGRLSSVTYKGKTIRIEYDSWGCVK